MDHRKLIASILSRLAEQIQGLSDQQLRLVEESKAHIDIKVTRARSKTKKKTHTSEEHQALLEQLQNSTSRAESVEFLAAHFPTKTSLAQFARFLEVPVQKRDKVDQIRSNITEATVGARIRSKAIRGE